MGIQVYFHMPLDDVILEERKVVYENGEYYDKHAIHKEWYTPLSWFVYDGKIYITSDFNHWGNTRKWLEPWLKRNKIEYKEV